MDDMIHAYLLPRAFRLASTLRFSRRCDIYDILSMRSARISRVTYTFIEYHDHYYGDGPPKAWSRPAVGDENLPGADRRARLYLIIKRLRFIAYVRLVPYSSHAIFYYRETKFNNIKLYRRRFKAAFSFIILRGSRRY